MKTEPFIVLMFFTSFVSVARAQSFKVAEPIQFIGSCFPNYLLNLPCDLFRAVLGTTVALAFPEVQHYQVSTVATG